MAIYHLSVKNITRTHGGKVNSSVAAAAYRAAETITDERTGLLHDYTHKKEVVYNEIFLCANAPKEYANRTILWNAVESVEKAGNARVAREWEVALPNELPLEEAKALGREFAQSLADEGMCVDLAIHWKPGNHHIHILGTTRPIKENGEWGVKEKKVIKLDADGNRVPLLDPETGEQKTRVRKGKGVELLWERELVECTGWNKREKVDEWRERWENAANRYLEPYGLRIDRRSYAEQGIERIPTKHEGAKARRLEKLGIKQKICAYNRRVKAYNKELAAIKREMLSLGAELVAKAKEKASLVAELARAAVPVVEFAGAPAELAQPAPQFGDISTPQNDYQADNHSERESALSGFMERVKGSLSAAQEKAEARAAERVERRAAAHEAKQQRLAEKEAAQKAAEEAAKRKVEEAKAKAAAFERAQQAEIATKAAFRQHCIKQYEQAVKCLRGWSTGEAERAYKALKEGKEVYPVLYWNDSHKGFEKWSVKVFDGANDDYRKRDEYAYSHAKSLMYQQEPRLSADLERSGEFFTLDSLRDIERTAQRERELADRYLQPEPTKNKGIGD